LISLTFPFIVLLAFTASFNLQFKQAWENRGRIG
jgi:hypothetical protein